MGKSKGQQIVLLSGAALLASCQLVSGLNDLHSGDTGSGGATSGSSTVAGGVTTGGPSTGTSNASSSTSVTSSTTSTAASGTGGAGGGPNDLTPCGGVVDDFTTSLDPMVWTTFGSVQAINGKVRATYQSLRAGIYLKSLTSYHECYATVTLLNAFNATSSLFVTQTAQPIKSEEINYTETSGLLAETPTTNTMATTVIVKAVGMAFHNTKVHFLYSPDGASWVLFASMDRLSWMDGSDTTIGFGIMTGSSGQQASFDNFNVLAVPVALLPP